MKIMSSFNITLIILLSLITFFGKGDAQVTGFRFVQRWPQAVCTVDRKCYSIVDRFTIHGLWPQGKSGTDLVNCMSGTSQFDETLVKDFRQEMLNAWPNFDNYGKSSVLWKAQWDKHGRCSEGILPQKDYFHKSSVELYPKINILNILSAKGIKPDNQAYYVKAIHSAFSKKVRVICKKDSKKQVLLYEIHTCLNSKLGIIDCTGTLESQECGGATGTAKFLKRTSLFVSAS